MEYWFTSDNHWYHANIIKYSNRPFESVEDMNERMIESWNLEIKNHDVVYAMGDWTFGNPDNCNKILRRLNGQIHLIFGNHDGRIMEIPTLFASVQCYKRLHIGKQAIMLYHYGGRVWDLSHRGSWQLFGHSHGTLPPYNKSVDVGVDSPYITGKAEYRPFHFDEIATFMNNQPAHTIAGSDSDPII